LKKKKQKNFFTWGIWHRRGQNPRLEKVFCFFFSKKKRLLFVAPQ
jgi:hypothetical protein